MRPKEQPERAAEVDSGTVSAAMFDVLDSCAAAKSGRAMASSPSGQRTIRAAAKRGLVRVIKDDGYVLSCELTDAGRARRRFR